jgi:prophage regulatory protein
VAEKVVRLPGVKAQTGLSRSAIYKLAKKAAFPRPVQLGPRAVGWLQSELDEWLARRVAARGGQVDGTDAAAAAR